MAKKRFQATKTGARSNPRADIELVEPLSKSYQSARVDLKVSGTIKVILTWNLATKAFLSVDGSREKFGLLRGGKHFAKYIRSLRDRIASSDFFSLDSASQEASALAYRAGLLSQYLLEYELLPTYLVKPELAPSFAFDQKSAVRLEEMALPEEDLREHLEQTGRNLLLTVWKEWPTKRVRLSRYGLLQVILERPVTTLVPATTFLEPLTRLHAPLGVEALARTARAATGYCPVNRSASDKLARISDELGLEVPIQWEIVGRILTWLINVIDSSRSPEDLIRFDPVYQTGWREREAKGGGIALPLRARFIVLHLEAAVLNGQDAAPVQSKRLRREIAKLLEGMALVGKPENRALSPQSDRILAEVERGNLATWNDEICYLSYDTALIASKTSPDLIMNLDEEICYGQYWPLVGRSIEYLNELRLLARFLEYKSSDLFEGAMTDLAQTKRVQKHEQLARFGSALAGQLARFRAASAPHTVARDGTLLSKINQLRSVFSMTESAEHSERNLKAIQRLVAHEESHSTETGVLSLTIGLAAFTAFLMGLALPPYYHYAFDARSAPGEPGQHEPLIFAWLPRLARTILIESWGAITVVLIVLALWSAFKYARETETVRRRVSAIRAYVFSGTATLSSLGGRILRRKALPASASELAIPFAEKGQEGKTIELVRCVDGKDPGAPTKLSISHANNILSIHFACVGEYDADALPVDGEPIWFGESVIVVLAPGPKCGAKYVEIQVGPQCAISARVVVNPRRLRSCMAVVEQWRGTIPRVRSSSPTVSRGWGVDVEIPLEAVLENLEEKEADTRVWSGNIYRLHRPPRLASEFSAWMPTSGKPVDLHRSDQFGVLRLLEEEGGHRARDEHGPFLLPRSEGTRLSGLSEGVGD